MPVHVSGQKGYDYQYLLSIYVALLRLEQPSSALSLYVENLGSEDATLIYEENSSRYWVDIQAKSGKEPVTLSKLSEWVNHFAANTSSSNIFSKLLDKKENRHYILVAEGRCDDQTKLLISDTLATANRTYSKSFLQAFSESIDDLTKRKAKSALGKNRIAFIKRLLTHCDSASFEQVLNSVSIWEQVTTLQLEEKIQSQLNRKFRIPQSQTSTVLSELEKIVREKGRNSGEDLIPHFKKLILRKSGNRPELNEHYVSRKIEDRLTQTLHDRNALLLTGISMCGKSETAKVVAANLVDSGYTYFHTSTITEASRFLNDSSLEDRICLLEDPFGHVSVHEHVTEIFESLVTLVNNLTVGRKLIVTSNRLITANLPKLPGAVSITDLTLTKSQVAELWPHLIKNLGAESSHAYDPMSSYLQHCTVDDVPQPGQLAYYIKNHGELKDPNPDTIRHFIALDSERLASKLQDMSSPVPDTLMTLALASNVITPVHVKDLAFILSEDDTAPGIIPKMPYLFRSDKGEAFQFPTYPDKLAIQSPSENSLHELEKRGFIKFSLQHNSYLFSHPTYYEAARYLIKRTPAGKFQKLIKRVKKALAALTPHTALHAAHQLRFLQQAFDDEAYYPDLINLGEYGLDSILPAVRDVCLVHMIRMFPHLNDTAKDLITQLIASNDSTDRRIRWHDQLPFITPETELDMSQLLELRFSLPEANLRVLIGKIESGEHISPREAWQIGYRLKQKSLKKPVAVNSRTLEKLLSFDEVFIREIAAYLIPYLLVKPSSELLERIFNDDHPFVVLEAIKGSFRAFSQLDKETQEVIRNLIDRAFSRQDVIITSTHFMTQFGIHYSGTGFDWRIVPEESQPVMWTLWGRLLPTFFDNLPVRIRFHTPRFWATMEDSLKILSTDEKLMITSSWLNWKIRYLKIKYADSHVLGLFEYFFSFAHHVKDERTAIMSQIISAEDPFLAAYGIRHLIRHWKILTPNEKKEILTRLEKGDYAYQAAALTTRNVPIEIQKLLLNGMLLSQLPDEPAWHSININLLHACIGILYVDSYYSPLELSSYTYWRNLLEESLNHSESTISRVGVQVMLEDYFRRFKHKHDWKHVPDKVQKILTSEDHALIDFTLLFLISILCHYNFIKDKLLIKRIATSLSEGQRSILTTMISENLEAVDLAENLQIAFRIIGLTAHTMVEPDLNLIRLIKTAEQSDAEDIAFINSVSGLIDHFCTHSNIRLPHTTFSWIHSWKRKHESKPEASYPQTSEAKRLELNSRGHTQETNLLERVAQQLSGFQLYVNK